MPEEQNQAPTEQPTPEQAAAPTEQAKPEQATPPAAQAAPKKSNGCMIAVIVVAVLIILSGVGIFVAYRFVKNKVNDTVSTDNGSTSINIGDNKGSVSTSGSDYAGTTDQKPTVTIISDVDNQLKPIFSDLFGGAKTNAWSSVDENSGSLGYITKNKVTSADYSKVKEKLAAIGYTSSSDYSSSEGSMIGIAKGDISLTIFLNNQEDANSIVVTVSKETASGDTE